MWHDDFVARCLQSPTPINDAAGYGVEIRPVTPADNEPYWRCIGVYHLRPAENRGGHHAFCAVRGEAGARVQNAIVAVNNNDLLSEAKCDKPVNEPDTNVPMRFGDTLTLRVAYAGLRSDTVSGIHTRHADEPGPGGELWNSVGHHSFFVVWQLTITGDEPEPHPNPDPPPDPTPQPYSPLDTLTIWRFYGNQGWIPVWTGRDIIVAGDEHFRHVTEAGKEGWVYLMVKAA